MSIDAGMAAQGDIPALPDRPDQPDHPDSWQLLYQLICSPQRGMTFLAARPAPAVTSGLFIAATLALGSIVGRDFGILGYAGALLMVGAAQLFFWMITVAQIHFWANLFGARAQVMGLFRASSGALVPLICLLPALMLLRSGVTAAMVLVLLSGVWALWRMVVAVAVVYRVDLVQAMVVVMAPALSLVFFAGLFMAGELSLLLQILKG